MQTCITSRQSGIRNKKSKVEKGETGVINLMMVLFDDEVIMRNHDATIRRETLDEDNISVIRNIVETLILTAQEAMAALKISKDKADSYLAKL